MQGSVSQYTNPWSPTRSAFSRKVYRYLLHYYICAYGLPCLCRHTSRNASCQNPPPRQRVGMLLCEYPRPLPPPHPPSPPPPSAPAATALLVFVCCRTDERLLELMMQSAPPTSHGSIFEVLDDNSRGRVRAEGKGVYRQARAVYSSARGGHYGGNTTVRTKCCVESLGDILFLGSIVGSDYNISPPCDGWVWMCANTVR